MSQIKSEKQYKAMMARIDELFFETDENTPADDPRLLELDLLSSLVEEYEKEHFPHRNSLPCDDDEFPYGGTQLDTKRVGSFSGDYGASPQFYPEWESQSHLRAGPYHIFPFGYRSCYRPGTIAPLTV